MDKRPAGERLQLFLVVGPRTRPEFADANQWLAAHTEVVAVSSPEQARSFVAAIDRDPECIVMVQSIPGQFQSSQVSELLRCVPLATSVALLGSWCEGETRSGSPLRVDRRLFWYEFVPGMEAAKRSRRVAVGTLSDEERWQRELNDQLPIQPARIGIACAASDQCDSLRQSLVAAGHLTRRISPAMSVVGLFRSGAIDALIWDDTASPRAPLPPLELLFDGVRPMDRVPTIALMTFPRIQTVMTLRDAGVPAVLPKPFAIVDLLWQLDVLLSSVRAAEAENRDTEAG